MADTSSVALVKLLTHNLWRRRIGIQFTKTARRLGIASAAITVLLTLPYAVTLGVGLFSLRTAQEPIGNPMFSIMEVLIIALAPAMVALMVALHAWAPADAKVLTLTSLIFMSLLAGVTTSLHFVILTLSRHAAFAHQQWSALVFSFQWPSVAYALDILAWDFFFPLSVLFAAGAFPHAKAIRSLLILSGVLALAGLSGVAFNDMRLRNIGIVGYVIVFPIAATLIAIMFYRTRTV